tara:strand:+ start:2825 stop:3505 length:681 start_codon:yes stop_codon:yes gene_type:complete
MNIAKNHLSNLANKGRFGDTELVHVNQQEKTMLEMAGGSGTTNPNTGLKEYFPWAAVTTGLSILEANKAGRIQSEAALATSQAAQEGIKAVDLAEGQLGEATEAKKELAILGHKKKVSDLSFTTETSVTDLNKQMDETVSKSNLATSGTATEKESEVSRRIGQTFTSGIEGLYGQLGETMAGIEQFQESEKSRLKMERARLLREKKMADKQAGAWYIGKGLGTLLS